MKIDIEDSRFGISVLSEGRLKIADLASLYCQRAD
ncbi:hypothetical protein F383_14884 [Gossypium arboreum]|uniref:Uncharacterized protein n=1 Tax=Gossypium arboreum TaxID=29729 RepID=A0A0B0PTN2_GOSAR|nr:hypothetical protein F383_14884 [Gossypium arboreum]